MSEYRVKVTTDLGDSKQQIASLQKDINVLTGQQTVKIAVDPKGLNLDAFKNLQDTLQRISQTKPFSFEFKQGAQISQTFENIQKHSKTTKDVLVQTYKITRDMDGPVRKWDMGLRRIGRNAAEVGKVVSTVWNNKDVDGMMNSVFVGAAASASVLVGEVAKIGFALYGLNEVIGILRAAWSGFFNETIGREVELRDTILRTRASLASTNKVFVDGKEITDPYEKILKLAGPVDKAIQSITERSIELAGVTSGEVINMFNMVAANIGKVGGTLKDAEDLAFAFAAGMGTLGMPGYMAPQEINSILGGYIDRNSRLAQALQISNEDIDKARGEEGGIVKFLKDRLEAVVAGQKIAAQGFTGVLSNIRDLYELTAGNFGAGLLDPLIAGLGLIFERLNGIRDQIFKIAKGAGTAISSLGAILGGMFTRGRQVELDKNVSIFDNRGAALESTNNKTGGEKYGKETLDYFDSLGSKIKSAIQNAFVEIGKAFKKFEPTLLILGDALRSLVMSFADIKVGTFNALVAALAAAAEVISRLTPAIATLINMWARLLNTPVVKYLYEVTTTMRVLKAAGGELIIQGFLIVRFIVSALGPAIAKIVQGGLALIGVFQAVSASIATLTSSIGSTVSGLGEALTGLLPEGNKGPQQIKEAGDNISLLGERVRKTGAELDTAKGKLQGLSAGMRALGLQTAFFFGKLMLVQLAIAAVVDAIGKYQKAQEDKRSLEEAGRALGSLQRNYYGLTRSLSAAEQADKSFKESLVNTEYDKAISKIRELKSTINQLKYEMQTSGINSWGEFWATVTGDKIGGGWQARNNRRIKELERQIAEQQKFTDAVNRDRDKQQADQDIQLANENRVNLEKEIGDLRRQIENDIFAKRQEALRAEVNLFRTQAELKMQTADRLNKKMLDDEQGRAKKGLEAVNNYLQVKMKGEVDIESAQREAQIEAAAIEKEIANYRIEMERKISEIRTRTQQNEIKAAEAAARQRTAENPLNTGDAFDTGLRTGPAGSIGAGAAYHQDLEFGAGVDLRQRRQLMVALAKKYDDLGKEIVLSNAAVAGRKFPLAGTADQQNQWIIDAQNAHYNRPGGSRRRAIDFYTPDKGQSIYGKSVEGTPMYAPSVPGADVSYSKGGGYGSHLQVTKDGQLILKLGHGDERRALPSNRKSPGNAAPATPSAAPAPVIENPAAQLPDSTEVTNRLAAQMQRAKVANDRARAIRAQITEANTKAALEDLGKSLFTPVELEEFKNQLVSIQEETRLLGEVTAEAYDPNKLAIRSDMVAKSKIAELALEDLEEKLPTLQDPSTGKPLDSKQQEEIKASFRDWYKKYIASVEDAAREGLKIVDAERTRDLTRSVKENIRMLPFEASRQKLQSSFGLAQAYDPTDATRSRLLEAELTMLQKKLDLEQQQGPLTEAQIALLNEELEARKQNAIEMAKFDEAIKELATQLELARGAAQAFAEGQKQFVQDILSGNNPSEALTNALQGTANKIMGMLLDQAFKPMEEQLFKAIRDVFNIKDPADLAREEAINTAKLANEPLITSQTSLKSSIDALNTTLQTASGVAPNGASTTNPTPSAPISALQVIPFKGDNSSSDLAKAEGAYTEALDKATDTKNKESDQAQQNSQKQFDFGKALSGATQAFGAVAMGIAGAQQLGKGGTYNTLMGLAGIFGALGSITGMFGTGGIFGPPKARASGGPVRANRPYLVGEIGPEIFMPSNDGEIISNAKSRKLLSSPASNSDSVSETTNTQALREGRGQEGYSAATSSLNDKIKYMTANTSRDALVDKVSNMSSSMTKAVLAEKNKTLSENVDTRRQTSLARVQFDFAYQSEVINNVEYVTSDQFQRGMAASAERGRALTLEALQNNISSRRKIGIS